MKADPQHLTISPLFQQLYSFLKRRGFRRKDIRLWWHFRDRRVDVGMPLQTLHLDKISNYTLVMRIDVLKCFDALVV